MRDPAHSIITTNVRNEIFLWVWLLAHTVRAARRRRPGDVRAPAPAPIRDPHWLRAHGDVDVAIDIELRAAACGGAGGPADLEAVGLDVDHARVLDVPAAGLDQAWTLKSF